MLVARSCTTRAAARPLVRLSLTLIFLLSLMAAAPAQDIAAGKQVFAKCVACHKIGIDAHNTIGPPLNGLFGRRAASVPGFAFSAALRDSGIVWDDQSFQDYIADPRRRVPGGKMAFAGIQAPQKIRDLAAYLKLFDEQGRMAAAVPPPPGPRDPAGERCRRALGSAGAEEACAAVGGTYLQAVGTLLAAVPADGSGRFDEGGLTDVNGDSEGSTGRHIALSAEDSCLIEEFAMTRGEEAWTSVPSQVDDLRKVGKLRAITRVDDLMTRAGAPIEDPAIVAVLLEGDKVSCAAPGAGGASAAACMGYLYLNVSGPQNRAAVFKALPIVRKACGLP